MPTLNAEITAVTVYIDRARVTRRGVAHVAPGEQTLVLGDLSPLLLEDSVRATGRGAGLKILGVQVETRYVTQPPEENVAELQRQLEALQDADKALADEDAATVARGEFLNTLRESSGRSLAKSFAAGKAQVERVTALAAYLTQELQAVNTQRRDIAYKRRQQKREMDAVQARLNQSQVVKTNRRREIGISVEAAGEGDIELEVTYVVPSASWKPLYDVRLSSAAGANAVTLTYLASVSQQSGEDWPPVELSLSTAHPAESAEIPELDPWYIDVERPRPVMRAPSAPMEAMVAGAPMPAPMAMRAPDMAPAAETVMATVEASGAAVTYRVARPVAVPSDGTPHKTTVTAIDLAARLDYITVPKLAEEAYLRAKIKNTSPFILLPGVANIFHGADFVGATELETVAPNEEFEAHLGVDDRIKVERELTERTVDKTLIGNTRRVLFGYKIKLANLLATPAQVTVYDQLPLSRHEDIKVKLRDTSPKPGETSDLNVLKWELELKPGEKRDIVFGFTVEHPRDVRLTGLTE